MRPRAPETTSKRTRQRTTMKTTLGPFAIATAVSAAIAALTLGLAQPAHAADDAAAEALARKSNCLKCHAVDKKKDGPSFKETSAKYKGKADAEAKLFTHLTTSPKIKVDGKEEEHAMVKSKDEAEVRNLVQWILSR
jgi:cytochrome c